MRQAAISHVASSRLQTLQDQVHRQSGRFYSQSGHKFNVDCARMQEAEQGFGDAVGGNQSYSQQQIADAAGPSGLALQEALAEHDRPQGKAPGACPHSACRVATQFISMNHL